MDSINLVAINPSLVGSTGAGTAGHKANFIDGRADNVHLDCAVALFQANQAEPATKAERDFLEGHIKTLVAAIDGPYDPGAEVTLTIAGLPAGKHGAPDGVIVEFDGAGVARCGENTAKAFREVHGHAVCVKNGVEIKSPTAETPEPATGSADEVAAAARAKAAEDEAAKAQAEQKDETPADTTSTPLTDDEIVALSDEDVAKLLPVEKARRTRLLTARAKAAV